MDPKSVGLLTRLLAVSTGMAALLFELKLLAASPQVWSHYLPDDGFYYLALGRNFDRLGYWTFDAGRTVTSGYHPLWAWLLAAIHHVFCPSTIGYVRAGILAGVLIVWLAVLASAVRPKGGLAWTTLLAGTMVWGSPNASLQAISCMEWPVVALVGVLYLRAALAADGGWRGRMALFFLGLAGSLARSDFGWFPGALLLVVLVAKARGRTTQPWGGLVAGVLGALSGIGGILLMNWAYTGSFLQNSALIKVLWAGLSPPHPAYPFTILASLFPGAITVWGKRIAAGALAVFGAWILRTRGSRLWRWQRSEVLGPRAAAVQASIVCLAGYLAMYARSAEVQSWYSANDVAPVLVLSTFAFRLLKARPGLLLSVAALILVMNSAILLLPAGQPYPWVDASIALSIHPKPGEVWAGWDCGEAGYYCDCGLVNLDGLMNNDIYPLLRRGNAALYPHQRGINRILGGQFSDHDWMARRGTRDPLTGTLAGELPPGGTPGSRVWLPPPWPPAWTRPTSTPGRALPM